MNKLELFLEAITVGVIKQKAWVIGAFSTIAEGPDDWKTDPYYLRLVHTATGNFYVDKDKTLVLIKDSPANAPIYTFKEPISLKAGAVLNLISDVDTTIGRLFVNASTLIYAFGSRIPYLNEKFNISAIEAQIVTMLDDTPAVNAPRAADRIYVDEYLRFVDAVQHLTMYSQLCIWAATAKTLVAAPGIIELRDKLLEQNKDRLHDPGTVAAIDKQLVAYDSAYLKGDNAENFLISKKSRDVVRKKLFGMHGGEQGLEGNVSVNLVPKSLNEGWDIKHFPVYNNSLRAGSFNRGSETQLGGEAAKWLFRASSNAMVTKDDCGSRVGKRVTVTEENVGGLVGFSVVATEGSKKVDTDEQAGAYLDRTVLVRSPMFCKLDSTDYCKVCVGTNLAANPTALSLAITSYGSAFLSLFLASAHGKSLQTSHCDYKTAIT